jgi:hypothetical protein
MEKSPASISALSIPLERDIFMRTLIRELSGTLQDVVGLDEASGFISVVGQRVGEQINQDYKSAPPARQDFQRRCRFCCLSSENYLSMGVDIYLIATMCRYPP